LLQSEKVLKAQVLKPQWLVGTHLMQEMDLFDK
jgi:hypothetical protein